MVKMI